MMSLNMDCFSGKKIHKCRIEENFFYQPWGHRLWAPYLEALGMHSAELWSTVGALHQPCRGHLDFRSTVNALFASSASSSADSVFKMYLFPLVHPCTGHLWLRSTEKNLGFRSFSIESRSVGVDSTCWLIFKGTIFIMFAMFTTPRSNTANHLKRSTLTTIESSCKVMATQSALVQIESIWCRMINTCGK